MITREKTTAIDLFSLIEEYDGLLGNLQAVTAELVTAIDAWDSDRVEELIDTRSLLCDRIGQSISAVTALAEGVDRFADAPVYRKLDETMQNALDKHQALIEQQGDTEQRLNRELQRRRPGMARMNERRGRHQAYRKSSASQHGRFLDSRL